MEQTLQPHFHPTDEDLITHFLAKKAADEGFRSPAIQEVDQVVEMDIYKCEPWDLPHRAADATTEEEAKWYFFCRRDVRTRWTDCMRTASGYWQARRRDEEVLGAGGRTTSLVIVGTKRTLVFFRGRAPHGERTNWLMHEYRFQGEGSGRRRYSNIEWVICRVFRVSSADKLEEQLAAAAAPSSDELDDSPLDQMNGIDQGTEQDMISSATGRPTFRAVFFSNRRGRRAVDGQTIGGFRIL